MRAWAEVADVDPAVAELRGEFAQQWRALVAARRVHV